MLLDVAMALLAAESEEAVEAIVDDAVRRLGAAAREGRRNEPRPWAIRTLARLRRLALARVRVSVLPESPLAALVEQTSDVILVVDEGDRIRFASPSARSLFGTSALSDRPFLDLVAGPERPLAQHLLRHARRSESVTDGTGRADLTMQGVDGQTALVEVVCRDLRSNKAVRGVAVTLRDVTGQRRLERDLKQQVFHDQLTGLPNRASLRDRIGQAFAVNTGVTGILLVDLDRFRTINEGLGRGIGDGVLVGVGNRLRETAGAENLVARSGGDEFAVLVPNAETIDTVDQLTRRLLRCFADPVRAGGDTISLGASIGVATTTEAMDEQELMRHADLALDAAKAAGRGRWRRYEPSMTRAARYRLELRTTLSRALEAGSIVVEYQPIVAFATRRTVGLEALVRWRHPTRGLLSPAEFIDIAEESDVIVRIGEHVLATAINDALEWSRPAGPDPPYVSVNVSVRQFRTSGFVGMVHRLLAAAGLPPERLILEITESLLLHDDDEVWEDLKRLRGWGVRIAIDDFGTGYSALSYLRQVPLDIVKLDRLFVATMTTSVRQRQLVGGIVDLIRTLHLETVAEGIETAQQRDISAAIGCTYGQGYLFSRSMAQANVLSWLANESNVDI